MTDCLITRYSSLVDNILYNKIKLYRMFFDNHIILLLRNCFVLMKSFTLCQLQTIKHFHDLMQIKFFITLALLQRSGKSV